MTITIPVNIATSVLDTVRARLENLKGGDFADELSGIEDDAEIEEYISDCNNTADAYNKMLTQLQDQGLCMDWAKFDHVFVQYD